MKKKFDATTPTKTMKVKTTINQPEVMHCTGRTVASTLKVFHPLWHLQDIKQHKSARPQFHTIWFKKTFKT